MRAKFFLLILIAAALVAYAMVAGRLHHPASPQEAKNQAAPASPLAILASPSVRWTSPVQTNEHGRLHMAFRVEASAPLQNIQVKVTPASSTPGGNSPSELHDIPTWLMGNKTIDWDGEVDLTGSLMAGHPASVEIVAVDEDHRSGQSEAKTLTLPERHFTQPLANALYTLRKGLQEDPAKRGVVLKALAGLLQQREPFENQDLTLLTLRSAAVRIALDDTPEGTQSALDLLWHAALLFEESPSNVTVSFRLSPKAPAKPE